MKIFMDESGNWNPKESLIVGAAELGGDADEIEKQIRDLHKRLCAKRSFAGHPDFENFCKNGFHSATDAEDVAGPFRDLMQSIFFRSYMVTTDRTVVLGDTEAARIEFMYVKLLSDLLIRHDRQREMLCYIEQSEGMRSLISRLPDGATQQAYKTLGRAERLPQLEIEMVAKGDYMSMALIDYVMASVTRWLRKGCTTDPKDWHYRGFSEIEPLISMLYSFERGLIVSRKTPLH